MRKYIVLFVSFAFLNLVYSNCSQSGFQSSGSSAAAGSNILTSSSSSGGSSSSGSSSGTSGGSSSSGSSSSGSSSGGNSGGNIVAITVGCGYVNEPCVSVKICVPGTTQCQTISNLLLDTGSAGLRIFSGAITPSLNANFPSVKDTSGRPYGTCAVYGDGSYQWGPIKRADVYLGQNLASNIPIEVIDFTFGDLGASCKSSAGAGGVQDAMAAGFNGILGVQFWKEDCGNYCVSTAGNGIYSACSGSSCTSAVIDINNQLINPVSGLSADNNGLIIQISSVPLAGASNVSGQMILGIGTQANNKIGSPSVFQADPGTGIINTTYNGKSYKAIIDSGSNAYYFPDSNIPKCSTTSGWYCPTSTQNLSAIIMDSTQVKNQTVSFTVASANTLSASYNTFSDLAGSIPSTMPSGSIGFIWGLPFFTGRTVYVGIEKSSSLIGAQSLTGPYWAY